MAAGARFALPRPVLAARCLVAAWAVVLAGASAPADPLGPGAGEAAPDSTDVPAAAPPPGRPGPAAKTARGATDQTVDAVRWVARRRQLTLGGVPYGFTGLPILYYSRNIGWNYGARLQWSDLRRRPYRYKLTVHSLRSTSSHSDTYLRLVVPRISDTGFGISLLVSDKRDIRARYYGRGNHSKRRTALTNKDSPLYLDEDYYGYILERPRLTFALTRQLRGPVALSVLTGGERTHISRRGDRAYYLDEGTPDGVRDGLTGFVGAGLQWDTRDDEVIPKQGVFHEWSYETARNSVLALFFEEIDYGRYTFTDARYWPLSPRVDLAHRTVFEVLSGSVPLYAYGEIGGAQRRTKGLGGGDSLRGFDTQRFTDNVRFFTNTELRYYLASSVLYRQDLEWNAVVFVDTGRVWPDVDALTLTGLHLTGGVSLRIYWNADFVIQAGAACSPEQLSTPVRYRNIF